MKTIVLSILSTLTASVLSHAQELRTITETSGPLNIPANSIVQIVGVAAGSFTTANSGFTPPSMNQTFADGTNVKTQFYQGMVPIQNSIPTNNNLVGSIFSGVSSISVQNGNLTGVSGSSGKIPVAVTVKIMSEASQVVSPPLVLPVDDEIFSISLETSTDMQDWVPAFPGDYLGSSNHRFFRVKAIKKTAAAPAAPAAPAK